MRSARGVVVVVPIVELATGHGASLRVRVRPGVTVAGIKPRRVRRRRVGGTEGCRRDEQADGVTIRLNRSAEGGRMHARSSHLDGEGLGRTFRHPYEVASSPGVRSEAYMYFGTTGKGKMWSEAASDRGRERRQRYSPSRLATALSLHAGLGRQARQTQSRSGGSRKSGRRRELLVLRGGPVTRRAERRRKGWSARRGSRSGGRCLDQVQRSNVSQAQGRLRALQGLYYLVNVSDCRVESGLTSSPSHPPACLRRPEPVPTPSCQIRPEQEWRVASRCRPCRMEDGERGDEGERRSLVVVWGVGGEGGGESTVKVKWSSGGD